MVLMMALMMMWMIMVATMGRLRRIVFDALLFVADDCARSPRTSQ